MSDEPKKRGRPTNSARDAALLDEALRKFNRIMSATRDDRDMSLSDRRFLWVPGAQWEGQWLEAWANKPRVEFNRLIGAANRLEADHRANRVTVKFMPKDGSPSNANAEALEGVFRSDWQDSNADESGDNMFSELIGGGTGAMKAWNDVADEEGDEDEQRVYFGAVYDADVSVYWPSDAKRQNKSDAEECFERYSMDRAVYEERFNDDPASWPGLFGTTFDGLWGDYYTPDVVYVVDWFKIERKKMRFWEYKTPLGDDEITFNEEELDARVTANGEDIDEDDEDESAPTRRDWLSRTGHIAKNEAGFLRKVKRVRKVTMSGGKVLIGPRYIAGKTIPIAPAYGVRNFVENKERYQGIVRAAKDPQRVFNVQVSKVVDIASKSAVKKPILFSEEVDDFAVEWSRDNIDDRPYLRRKPMMDVASGQMLNNTPINYTQVAEIPAATVGLLQITTEAFKDILGDFNSQEKVVSNTSTETVQTIQQAVDRLTAVYLDNYAQGIKRLGEIWLSMARDVYWKKGRKLKTIGADMRARGTVTVGEPGVTEQGKLLRGGLVDFSAADFDVVVEVGPSSSTKKQNTVRALVDLLRVTPQQDLESQKAILLMILANMDDAEGLGDMTKWARLAAARLGVVKPTEDEQMQLQKEAAAKAQQRPDPQAQLMQAATEKETALATKAKVDTLKAGADVELARANREKTDAMTRHTEAQTLQTLSDIHGKVNAPPEPAGQPPPKTAG